VGECAGPSFALEQHPGYLDLADEQVCLLVQIETARVGKPGRNLRR
jgi:2-keto-3-deoxy-L-rhamnonate aldolase RhmA